MQVIITVNIPSRSSTVTELLNFFTVHQWLYRPMVRVIAPYKMTLFLILHFVVSSPVEFGYVGFAFWHTPKHEIQTFLVSGHSNSLLILVVSAFPSTLISNNWNLGAFVDRFLHLRLSRVGIQHELLGYYLTFCSSAMGIGKYPHWLSQNCFYGHFVLCSTKHSLFEGDWFPALTPWSISDSFIDVRFIDGSYSKMILQSVSEFR
jgi:hypothetical protein